MNRFLPQRRPARLALAALTALATLAGCAHKITQTDASYTAVEGLPNADARMVTWVQAPTLGYRLNDGLIVADITDDGFKGPVDLSPGVAGRVHLQIIDRTPASGFDLFRRSDNGGYQRLLDYPVRATLKWLDTEWELYRYVDASPVGGPASNYVGRGLLQGVSGVESPLTNPGPPEGAAAEQSMRFLLGNRLQADSTMDLIWSLDPRAVGYWVQVMPFGQMDGRVTSDLERNEALPVLESAGARTTITAYVDAPAAGPPTATFLAGSATIQPASGPTLGLLATLHKNTIYFARVCAVDASGRVINRLQGDYRVDHTGETDHIAGPGGTTVASAVYTLHPLGGVVFGSFTPTGSEKPAIDFVQDFRTWDRSGLPPGVSAAAARGGH